MQVSFNYGHDDEPFGAQQEHLEPNTHSSRDAWSIQPAVETLDISNLSHKDSSFPATMAMKLGLLELIQQTGKATRKLHSQVRIWNSRFEGSQAAACRSQRRIALNGQQSLPSNTSVAEVSMSFGSQERYCKAIVLGLFFYANAQ